MAKARKFRKLNFGGQKLNVPGRIWDFGGCLKAGNRCSEFGWKELLLLFNLSTRASKTEFVCKSYGLSKFAVKTCAGAEKTAILCRGRVTRQSVRALFLGPRSDKTADFEVDSDSAAAAGKSGNFCRGRKPT